MRKLASIQRIAEVKPIEGADRIVAYRVLGWWIVDQKDRYKVGDSVVFCEVDSWIPTDLAPFLSKGKEPREYNGIKGEKLRTVKLKKQLSQGLILPGTVLHGKRLYNVPLVNDEPQYDGLDVSEVLGIVKWEPPAELIVGDTKGLFPSFLRKTDQERIQNCYDLYAAGEFADWYLEEKLEGQSFTAYLYNGVFGVCSRNLELKDGDNTFWNNARKYKLEEKLRAHGENIAVQCEQIGPGIQANYYGLSEHKLAVFDVFEIDSQEYFNLSSRNAFARDVLEMDIPPALGQQRGNGLTLDEILKMADGASAINPKKKREGIIWRNTDGLMRWTFKAISNDFLMEQE